MAGGSQKQIFAVFVIKRETPMMREEAVQAPHSTAYHYDPNPDGWAQHPLSFVEASHLADYDGAL